MEDFNALAAKVAAGVGDVRGCLILSRDGLVMGEYPDGSEARLKAAWVRFGHLGEPDRSFVQFGDEVWCFLRRGPYASFVVTDLAVRPGLVIDQIEQALLAAEDARLRRDALKLPEAPGAPSGKPRTSLHPEPRPVEQPVLVRPEPAVAAAAAPREASPVGDAPAGPSDRPPEIAPADQPAQRTPEPEQAPSPATAPDVQPPEPAAPSAYERLSGNVWGTTEEVEGDGDEVDRVQLAREFSQLLQENDDFADG